MYFSIFEYFAFKFLVMRNKNLNMIFRIFLFALLLTPLLTLGQSKDLISLQGAWETTVSEQEGEVNYIAIVADKYVSVTRFSKRSGMFYGTSGGAVIAEDGVLKLTYEYFSSDPSLVGTVGEMEYAMDGNNLKVEGFMNRWKKLDSGKPGALANAWLITGREREGKMTKRKPGPRKTMKILSGTRFQWIAYNVETKEFMGTGGGTYTTVDGIYTENIDFFSRDNSRVGASLEFDFELEEDDWHHSGLSSKGSEIYEVWSPRSTVEKPDSSPEH